MSEKEEKTNAVEDVILPLKRKGAQGLIAAGSVLGVLVLIVILSKMNEIRHHRLPVMWRGRLKRMVSTSAKHLRIAEETTDSGIAMHHAVQAQTTLESAQTLVGSASLAKFTGMNIEELEKSIEDVITTLSAPAAAAAKAVAKKGFKTRFE
jgi:ABC-type lipoprotein release transport system permease subunit